MVDMTDYGLKLRRFLELEREYSYVVNSSIFFFKRKNREKYPLMVLAFKDIFDAIDIEQRKIAKELWPDNDWT
jgi:hypothetical protein